MDGYSETSLKQQQSTVHKQYNFFAELTDYNQDYYKKFGVLFIVELLVLVLWVIFRQYRKNDFCFQDMMRRDNNITSLCLL